MGGSHISSSVSVKPSGGSSDVAGPEVVTPLVKRQNFMGRDVPIAKKSGSPDVSPTPKISAQSQEQRDKDANTLINNTKHVNPANLSGSEARIPSRIAALLLSNPEEGAKQLAKYQSKVDQILGSTRKVDTQQDLGRDLDSNTLGPVLSGLTNLDKTKLSESDQETLGGVETTLKSAQKRVEAMQKEQGILTTDTGKNLHLDAGDIKLLLKSPKAEDRELGREALKALCDICNNPKILAAAVSSSGMAASAANTLDPTQIQTSFIKFTRNIVAKTYFQSELTTKLSDNVAKLTTNQTAASFTLQNPKIFFAKGENKDTFKQYEVPSGVKLPKIDQYIANVGFNRLMSENNVLGASLSSDVDFKLVFDDEKFKADFKAANPQLKAKFSVEQIENIATQAARKAQETMVDTLKLEKSDFFEAENGLNLTLEVADFTVKNLSTLRKEAAMDPKEKNFLATVMHNSTLMSGNPSVLQSFKNVIDTNLGNIPTNWREIVNMPPDSLEARKMGDHRQIVIDKVFATANIMRADIGLQKSIIKVLSNDPELTAKIKEKVKELKLEGTLKANKIDINFPEGITQLLSNKAMFNKLVSPDMFVKAVAREHSNVATSMDNQVVTFNRIGLASRNWEQNLGNSDKGSMTAITHLPEIENVVKKTIEGITAHQPHIDLALAAVDSAIHKEEHDPEKPITEFLANNPSIKTALESGTAQEKKEALGKLLNDCPIALKKVLGTDLPQTIEQKAAKEPSVKLSTKLLESDDLKGVINNFHMFGSEKHSDKLDMAVGLLKTFTKYDDSGGVNRHFIGSATTKADDNWMYSVKFSGCRLNDMFDMVPKDVYESSFHEGPSRDTAVANYDHSKTVAGALNAFAVQIQDRTYEHYSEEGTHIHVEKRKDVDGNITPVTTSVDRFAHGHTEMDTKYDRITGIEFSNMLTKPEMKENFKVMMNSLSAELGKLPPGPLKTEVAAQIKVVTDLSIAMDPKKLKALTEEMMLLPVDAPNKQAMADNIHEIIALKNKLESSDINVKKEIGFTFFSALSVLGTKAADNIKIT
jgi:hypothetical protein